MSVLAMVFALPLSAQYKSEKDATIPLEHFYIERKKSALRQLLSKLRFGLSTGYGRSFYHHSLEGFGILQEPDSLPVIFRSTDVNSRYSNWINTASSDPGGIAPGAFQVNSDTADLGFRARSFSIPLKATVHVELDRYRIGGGYSYEYVRIGNLRPTSYGSEINSLPAPVSNFFMRKYFIMGGASIYRYYEYLLVADVNVGGYKMGRSFDNAAVQKGLYFNVGLTVERDMSEYFKVFVRPSYELKNYRIAIPEGGPEIKHKFNALYLNVGVTYRIPELRRCYLKACHIQINHAHGNREYRSRRHPFWKKQNPHYGENYPTLIKYKGRNKRKSNPY